MSCDHPFFRRFPCADDGWQLAGAGVDGGYHDSMGNPIVNRSKFSSLSAFVDSLHGMGLRAGWYLNNCWNADKCYSLACFQGNIALVVEAGFDSVKIDSCSAAKDIQLYANLINWTSSKAMTIENCHNGPYYAQVPYTPASYNRAPWCPFNLYRVSTDIGSAYEAIMAVNLAKSLGFLAQNLSFPGCWAYPDMLEVGVLPGLHSWEYWLPYNEARAHFNAWAITSSPLVLSHDLTNSTTMDYVWPIISNWEAIAVNQAWGGYAGGVLMESAVPLAWADCGWYKNCTIASWQVLYKPLPHGAVALQLLNHDSNVLGQDVTVAWSQLPSLTCGSGVSSCPVRDLNAHADLGTFTSSYTFKAGSVPGRTDVLLWVGSTTELAARST